MSYAILTVTMEHVPENCRACSIHVQRESKMGGYEIYCPAENRIVPYVWDFPYKFRPEWCPLVIVEE